MSEKLTSKFFRLLILTLIATVYLIPIVMMVFGSFKTPDEAVRFDLALPSVWVWENYAYVIENGNVFTGYFNSILYTVCATAFVLLSGSLTGIYVGRTKSRCSSFIYSYFIMGLTLTFQITSTYSLLLTFNLLGTRIAIILIYAALQMPFTIMTFSSFIKGVPREIDEAGYIDGCNSLQVIFSILLPIMKPIFITNLIVVAIGCWNNFMIPLFYATSSTKWTIPLMVYNFFGRYNRNWNYVFAMLTITIVPVIILYLCLQKYIVKGMTAGAVKG